jgi:hypothetical protein
MEHPISSLDELYEKLTIEDGEVIIAAGEIQSNKETFILVGKFLTEKSINFNGNAM